MKSFIKLLKEINKATNEYMETLKKFDFKGEDKMIQGKLTKKDIDDCISFLNERTEYKRPKLFVPKWAIYDGERLRTEIGLFEHEGKIYWDGGKHVPEIILSNA